MKSGKQRRQQIKTRRAARAAGRARLVEIARRKQLEAGGVNVDEGRLAPNNSYGRPEFVQRGYYIDMPFRCKDCGKEEIWTAAQQKWWYEIAKGDVYSMATRCRTCRRKEQARRREARRVHLEGLSNKLRKHP